MKCANKIQYRTKAIAKMTAGVIRRERGETLYVYKCPHCRYFHLTHQLQDLAEKLKKDAA